MQEVLEIDGSEGEGGGQILRSCFALSALTQRPIRIQRIRARRSKPGLMRQHLVAIRAAAAICRGQLEGDRLGGDAVTFWPGRVVAGRYHFPIGSAGSTTLVFQTVLWPLLVAAGNSSLRIEGGTHNPLAPSAEFLDRSFLAVVRHMGARIGFDLARHGFYPAGGGAIALEIAGGCELQPLSLERRGTLGRCSARALVSALDPRIAERELAVVREVLGWPRESLQPIAVDADGPGNALLLEREHGGGTTVVTAIGSRGKRAEVVAREAAEEMAAFERADVPVDAHLADQLLIPMALAGTGSFRTLQPTLHTRTQADIVQRFLPVHIRCAPQGDAWRIDVTSR